MNQKTRLQVNNRTSNTYSVQITKHTLKSGQSVFFYSWGSSMKPLIFPGWKLIVIPAQISELTPGDIALYEQKDGTIVAHRLINIEHNESASFFFFKGDNRCPVEGPIPEAAILGKVTKITSPWFSFSPEGRIVKVLYPLICFMYHCASGVKHIFNRKNNNFK